MTLPDAPEGLEYVVAHIIQDFMHYMHQTGLSRPQIHALLHIFHAGECRVSEIAVLSGATPAAASQLVERLVQQGLVERSEDPGNRRIKRLRLTRKGLDLVHAGIASNRFLAGLMDTLPPRQRQVVETAFRYLAQAGRQLRSSPTRKVEQHA
jgi:DNA-binding MarR family transcriptional regulator